MGTEIDTEPDAVAVVGLACRVPGARDAAAFWRDVCAGTESVTRFGRDELRAAGVADAELADPAYVPAGGWLEDVDRFDAGLFGVPAREASAMDPQHRIFLECVWTALEDAGVVPETPHRTGVFAGASSNDWLLRLLRVDGLVDAVGLDQVLLGAEKDYLVSRVAYRLGLTGPALAVQTACSSSLAAVHLAARALLTLECDVAVAGGVSVTFVDPVGYRYEQGGVLSPDGRCRAFDDSAAGTVAGNGAGVVVLRRLSDALADGDPVRAVLRGTAMNNDGAARVGFTAPGVHGQAEVIAEALAAAGVGADTVDYLEAHGTGTAIGDPIELTALGEVFGGRAANPVLVGSVKPNIGHLDAASGIVGLIKAVLAVEAGLVPPTINLRTPTTAVDWDALGVAPNTALRPWPATGDRARRAGVSSFGIGGTNVHVVVDSAPAVAPAEPVPAGEEIVTVSGADEVAVGLGIEALTGHARRTRVPLRDLAATTRTGRYPLTHRAAAVCGDLDELGALDAGTWLHGRADTTSVVLLFPDQAAHPGAGSELYEAEPVFRSEVDRCAGLLGREPDRLFVLEYALARLWRHWGVSPLATIGCGIGELVAACLAGVIALPDALHVAEERTRLLSAGPAEMAAEEFTAVLAGVSLHQPDRPFVSTVGGDLVDPATLTDPRYWGRQLCAPPRVTDAVHQLATVDGAARPLFVEVGPGDTLTAEVRRALPGSPAVASLPGGGPAGERSALRRAVAKAWVHGAPVDWARHGGTARRVPLPTYPFASRRHWPDGLPRATTQAGLYAPAAPAGPPPVDARVDDVTEFLLESWQELLGEPDVCGDSDFFELGGESLLAVRLTERLHRRFGVRIPPTQLFDTPTVDTLAAVVRGADAPPTDLVADLVEEIARAAEGRGDG